MKIYELDVVDRLECLEQNFSMVTEIKNSLSENRAEYRSLANNIGISQESLMVCCDNFERSLLIECYTFSEQLVKNSFYRMIEFDNNNNEYVKSFIKNKVSKARFSPNVKFEEIEKMIKNQLFTDFKFLYPKNNSEIGLYNEMVKSRHVYAHKGIYEFQFNDFYVILNVLKYLYFELSFLNSSTSVKRREFQNKYFNLKENVKKVSDIDNNLKYQRNCLKKVKNSCCEFIDNYGESFGDIVLLEEINIKIIKVANQDLRKYKDIYKDICDLHRAMN